MAENGNGRDNGEGFALGVFVAVLLFIFFHRQIDKFLSRFALAPGGAGATRGASCGKCGGGGSACNCGGGTGTETSDNPEVTIGYGYSGGLSADSFNA